MIQMTQWAQNKYKTIPMTFPERTTGSVIAVKPGWMYLIIRIIKIDLVK